MATLHAEVLEVKSTVASIAESARGAIAMIAGLATSVGGLTGVASQLAERQLITEKRVAELAEAQKRTEDNLKRTDEHVKRTEDSVKRTSNTLNALIRKVDRCLTRDNGPRPA